MPTTRPGRSTKGGGEFPPQWTEADRIFRRRFGFLAKLRCALPHDVELARVATCEGCPGGVVEYDGRDFIVDLMAAEGRARVKVEGYQVAGLRWSGVADGSEVRCGAVSWVRGSSGSVSGRVLDAHGQTVSGAHVWCGESETSDADGEFYVEVADDCTSARASLSFDGGEVWGCGGPRRAWRSRTRRCSSRSTTARSCR